jgi:2-succinyl-5-enolpyruvyl-6-hydroxy-3-cyclohexene-1-carboxylate synthase
MSNRNLRDAEILFDELACSGVKHVCLSPGSRNTPLVFAAARHAGLRVTSHLDERSAAFFALGIGIATGVPAVLVCTSGSAAANYYPAVVEAHQSRVPLLVITADRPHELRHSGANQTMKQPDLFGSFALWAVDLALPEAQPAALITRNLRTTAARAVAIARGGEGQRAGVVHLNMPFRPPLEPTDVTGDLSHAPDDAKARPDGEPFTQMVSGGLQRRSVDLAATRDIARLLAEHERGLIVCGPRARGAAAEQLAALSQLCGYPLLCDGVSGLRFGVPDALAGYDSFLNATDLPPVELVIRFGDVPTSKWLNQYLDRAQPKTVIHVSDDGVWADDSHRVSHFVHTDVWLFVATLYEFVAERLIPGGQGELSPALSVRRDSAWLHLFRERDAAIWRALDTGLDAGAWFDAIAIHDALALAPADATIYAGNSLPVRHVDQFGRPGDKRLFVHANRGVSGIDGNVSTALGLGHARPEQRLILLIGDVTLYHDMNGLLAVKRNNVPLTIVLLNNNGGGIFQRLPVNQHDPEFTTHFVTPHGLDYAHVAALYGLDHVRPRTRAEFQAALCASFESLARSVLIEVQTDAVADLAARKALFSK